MNILFVISEMAPLVKVGGVGDVGGSLPKALARLGHDVRIALPFYRSIDHSVAREQIASDGGATLWRAEHDGLAVYLLQHEAFERDEVYGYDDDVARFLSFCDSLVANADALGWAPNVVHMHDWHTGLLAARLAGGGAAWPDAATFFTIHNLGYRGEFDEAFASGHRLPAERLRVPSGVEPAIAYSSLAQGILHAGSVTTVSPTYAREILEPEQGGQLAPLLRSKRSVEGILNGIDTEEYDPSRDPHLAVNYDAASLDKRAGNKTVLQQKLGLPARSAPLIGMVTRLFEQKAPDLGGAAIDGLLGKRDFQFAVLGTGAAEYEKQLNDLAAKHPDRVAARIAFDYGLGQQIYGGCDVFLMPSRYEPCGLGQMIAMRYGAVPVVRHTGGLADSVSQYHSASASGTGFLFDDLTADRIIESLNAALDTYEDKSSWRKMQVRGMQQDFSWDNAAHQYIALYERAGASAGARSD